MCCKVQKLLRRRLTVRCCGLAVVALLATSSLCVFLKHAHWMPYTYSSILHQGLGQQDIRRLARDRLLSANATTQVDTTTNTTATTAATMRTSTSMYSILTIENEQTIATNVSLLRQEVEDDYELSSSDDVDVGEEIQEVQSSSKASASPIPRPAITSDHVSATLPTPAPQRRRQTTTMTTTTTTTTMKTTTTKSTDQDELEEQIKTIASKLTRPARLRTMRGKWQMVEDKNEIYIMTAYYDDRPLLLIPHVRVIGIAEQAVSDVFCLLWYNGSSSPKYITAQIISVGPRISPTSTTVYEQFIFSCPLTGNSLAPPDHVSLVTPHNHFRPSTLLPVQVPVKPGPGEQLEFGHCMSIMYRKQDPYRLVEWLELHRLWGVSEFNIYTTAVDNITSAVLDWYSKRGIVRHQQMPSAVDETDSNEHAILLNMSPAINDCLYANLYRYKYTVCTDIDEMIVPTVDKLYTEMLKRATAAADINKLSTVHSFLFRNAYFFLDFGATYSEPWYLLTQRYTKRVSVSRFGYSSKSITRTLSCIGLQNHVCWKRVEAHELDANWNVDVPVNVGKNHHYKKCHFDEYHSRNGICLRMMTRSSQTDNAVRQFMNDLSERVIDRLTELDLVEPTADDKWKLYNPVP